VRRGCPGVAELAALRSHALEGRQRPEIIARSSSGGARKIVMRLKIIPTVVEEPRGFAL
jgi:hypothetical protein